MKFTINLLHRDCVINIFMICSYVCHILEDMWAKYYFHGNNFGII